MKVLRPRIQSTLVALWLTLSIASVVLAALIWKQLAHSIEAAVVMGNFNELLLRVFSSLQDAEIGERGFIITGREIYLEPFYSAEGRLPEDIAKLSQLTLADKALERQVLELRVFAESLLATLRRGVEARREHDFETAAAIVASGEGRTAMDGIRKVVLSMQGDRVGLFSDHGADTRRQLKRASVTSLTAGLLGVAAGFFALYLTRQSLQQARRERELAEAKLLAERQSEQKSAFLANMSHEIRTPMNAILGFSDLLAADLREPRQRQFLKAIRTSADSLLQLINDVLDMSKIEAGVAEVHPEPTDPREICEFIHAVFLEQATRKGVKLSCDVAVDLPHALLLDRTRLRQVLVNLVGNAVKFTERGFICVRVQWEPHDRDEGLITLFVEVEDTGVGIPPQLLDAVFKPFVQTDAHREAERQGTGLGLAIVKRLIELLGGTISVASVMNRGSTFHLRLPGVPISPIQPQTPGTEVDPPVDFNEQRPARLLLVDDNETNRQLLAGIFERTHHELHFGSNGREAVELARRVRPSAVLMDIRMPVLDGRSALTEIREIPGLEHIPIIAVTASSMGDRESDLCRLFSGYVRKPFSRRALYEVLAEFLPRIAPAPAAPVLHQPLAATPPTDKAGEWAEIAVKLHQLEGSDWPPLRDSLAINEIRAFASKLRAFGTQGGCSLLTSYADHLTAAAAAYDVKTLETELGRFPEVLKSIESLTV